MSNLKAKVKKLLDSAGSDTKESFFESRFDEEYGKYDNEEEIAFKTAFQSSGIAYNFEDNYGGEDCGSEYWSVYKFTKDGESIYVKFEGSYYSYDGSTFDEWYFAKPVPKQGFDFVQDK